MNSTMHEGSPTDPRTTHARNGSTGSAGSTAEEAHAAIRVPDKFGTVPFSDIQDREIDWLLPGLLPRGFLTALVGDEGVGKGLYSCMLMAQVTAGPEPADVLLLAGEDDPESMIRPRLRAAGADLNRVHLTYKDKETKTGLPILPDDMGALRGLVDATSSQLVVIDPWLALVAARLQVKDTQQARRVFDPVARLARETGVAILLVGHTNRGDSTSARNRYGATVGIRQVARLGLMALPDPEGPEGLLVGVKSVGLVATGSGNVSKRQDAANCP